VAKNYPALYEGGNDSIALEQKIYIKAEPTGQRGTLQLPAPTDFLFHIGGASINFTQPIETSPHKSGRHHQNIIKQKTTSEWTLPTFFNINEALGSASVAVIDPAVRVLHKAMFGNEDVTGGFPVYDTSVDPNTTFTMMEIGDVWAKQAPGCFVESANIQMPGDGQSQVEWSGMAKTVLNVGIGKSITNNTANTITLATGEGRRFPVGAFVMIVKATNVRSTDTPANAARTVTAVSGDVVTVDGAALTDANGSVTPIYLTYYEPNAATAIDNPVVGLVGSISIAGFTAQNCIRNLTLNCTNSHEPVDYCFGEEGLGGPLFIPGGRFTAEVTLEMNLNKELLGFINKQKDFLGEDLTIVLGSATGRRLQILVPKAIFQVPEIPVGESGSIPITFTGNANQTGVDAADEIQLSYL
jgi:hypothetical protein